MYSVHEKSCVNVNLLFILWPAQQVLGEIYFRINGEQRREYWWWWGVVTPLWSDDASYTFGRVGSESPKTWGQEFGRLGKDRGGRSKVSLFDSAVFGTSLWHSESPRSHTFCLPVFVFLVALLPSFVTSSREHWKCHIWFTNVRLTIEMCGREERVRRKREDTNKSRTKNFPGRTQKGGDWTPPWTSYYRVVRAIRRTGCSGQNGWWSNGEGGLPAINCCHNWSPTLTTGFSNAGMFYIYWCSNFLSLTRSSCCNEKSSSRYNRKWLVMFVWI